MIASDVTTQNGNPLMMYVYNCLASFWEMGRTADFAHIWPPIITLPMVKEGCAPIAGIIEGATLPTKNI